MTMLLLFITSWLLINLAAMLLTAYLVGDHNLAPSVIALGTLLYIPFAIVASTVMLIRRPAVGDDKQEALEASIDAEPGDTVAVGELDIPVMITTLTKGYSVSSFDYPDIVGQGKSLTRAKYDFYLEYKKFLAEQGVDVDDDAFCEPPQEA